MFDIAKNLGVQSWCFRHFKMVPELIGQLHALGLSRVELCGVHADFNDEKTHGAVIKQFKDAGISISSIGVQTFRGDAAEEKWFAFAQAAGAKMIATNFALEAVPGVFDFARKLSEKYGVKLGIHNHGGYHWIGSLDMVRHLIRNSPYGLGLCLDTAWAMQTGEDVMKWVEGAGEVGGLGGVKDRLYGIHVKDFVFDRAGKWTDVVVGTGNLPLSAFLKAALNAPNLTTVTIEYEGDVENPLPKLKECVAAIRAAM